jgi:hypothetical protein
MVRWTAVSIPPGAVPSRRHSIPLPAISLSKSDSVGCGASPVAELPEARRRFTMCRSSSSVSTESRRTFSAAAFRSGSRVETPIAPACTAIRLTWCETTSCISRASWLRSAARIACASSTRSCSRASRMSSSRSASSCRAWTSLPKKIGAAAVIVA